MAVGVKQLLRITTVKGGEEHTKASQTSHIASPHLLGKLRRVNFHRAVARLYMTFSNETFLFVAKPITECDVLCAITNHQSTANRSLNRL